jgi:hypothetical protein
MAEVNVKRDQVEGFRTGSRERYWRRMRGVDAERAVGRVEVRSVIGIRWVGIM